MKISSSLNYRAHRLCGLMHQLQEELRIEVELLENGAMIFDYGVLAAGGLRAGVHLAEICLAGMAEVRIEPGRFGQAVTVYSDHPVTACLASQYAGWQVTTDDYFAMGSGPMRAAYGNEPIIQELECTEKTDQVVGVLESSKLPTEEVCQKIADACGVEPKQVSLCVAPTSSLAGTIQVVARSVETTLHKIHEVGFDVRTVRSGFGVAPLPPVAANDLEGIGRTNDAILYAGEVTLWVDAEDDPLRELVSKVPSNSSRDHGTPFADIFKRYDGDFYKIDPHLFSPARVQLISLRTGRTFEAGEVRDDLVRQSFVS